MFTKIFKERQERMKRYLAEYSKEDIIEFAMFWANYNIMLNIPLEVELFISDQVYETVPESKRDMIKNFFITTLKRSQEEERKQINSN